MSKTATRKGVVAGQAGPSQDEKPAAAAPTDWEAIERKYRAGALSLREIAKQHGVSDTAIRKRAKAHGWARDLTAKVQEQVRTELVRAEVRTENARTEREIVEEAAAAVVDVVRRHRRDSQQAADLCRVLLEQVQHVAENRDVFEEAIVQETAEADTGETGAERAAAKAQRKAMLAAVSLPGHAAVVRDLSTALSKLHAIDRQAWNMDAPPPPKPAEEGDASSNDAALAAFDRMLEQRLSAAPAGQ